MLHVHVQHIHIQCTWDFLLVAICSVFKNSWSLEWLDLTACDVGHKGTTCLAGVIRVSNWLIHTLLYMVSKNELTVFDEK